MNWFADATAVHEALSKVGSRKRELIVYEDSDYPGEPFPKRHPGPSDKPESNVE